MCGNVGSKTRTLLVVILDESSSMAPQKSQVLRGFNEFLQQQKKVSKDRARLFLVKFNNRVTVLHSGVSLKRVPRLNNLTYTPSDETALYDAVAEGVRLAESHKMTGERVLCVIVTDGEDNASRLTTRDQVTQLISSHESQGDWTFAYIGKNPERWAEVTRMAPGNVTSYDQQNVRTNLETFSAAVTEYRSQSVSQSTTIFVGSR